MDNTAQIQMNLIGYNEKGFVGFMTGGHYLSYLETPKNADELIEKLNLPYISHDDVKAVNKYADEHPGEFNIVEFDKEKKNVGKRKRRKTSNRKLE